jgi:antitoxin ParD1/3/4
MNVSLTPQLERLVAERVESGRYASAGEVIREALRLEERDRLTTLRRDIDGGIDALDRGESRRPFDKAAIARIKRAGRERLSREPTPRSKAR